MSRYLLLLRHAKSAWDTGAASDFDRPLAGRGERDAPTMGKWLKNQGLVPNTVISSPALRAKQTSEAACRKMGIKPKEIRWDNRVYAATVSELLKVLEEYKKQPKTLMLVGHNPGLEDLLIYLVGGAIQMAPDGKLLPTAAVAYLKMPSNWKDTGKGAGQLVSITRVKNISLS
jgi:phosphohistidine phosphatase